SSCSSISARPAGTRRPRSTTAASRSTTRSSSKRRRAGVPAATKRRADILNRAPVLLERVESRTAMEWTEDGIVLGVKRHGEANAILELMTADHGRHLGLVRGGAGSRLRPVLQPGNSVRATWRARLDEHLGNFTVEGLNLRAAAYLAVPHALYGITHAAALCRLLPERDPHPAVYASLVALVECLMDVDAVAALMARFELDLLAELGFGLDLTSCAATGACDDLIYVSPKSGRAVSRAA